MSATFFRLHGYLTYYLANRLHTLSLFRRTMAPLADRISVARMLLDFVCHSKWNVFVLGRPSHDDPSAPMGAAVRRRGAEVLLGLDGSCARPGSISQSILSTTRHDHGKIRALQWQ